MGGFVGPMATLSWWPHTDIGVNCRLFARRVTFADWHIGLHLNNLVAKARSGVANILRIGNGMMDELAKEGEERALLVQVITREMSLDRAADSLSELERLADTAGARVVGAVTQRRDRPSTGFLVGKGKLEAIQMSAQSANANLLIVDNPLTAVQVNNLDLAVGVKVIDRTELILQIFARRAQSAEAKVQVELAQLQYLVGRIPVSEKQQRFQGGIGMRGPGESPLQLRNAPMRRRIADLKRRLAKIQKQQSLTRKRRQIPQVCLVGYTNAGKSTLLNALASANAYVDDRLFATLDTKTRRVHVGEGHDILLSDSVGFIRHLPHGLVASFRSTLDVAVDADLLLLVLDVNHHYAQEHLDVVRDTLVQIGAGDVPALLVFNKIDLVDADDLDRWCCAYPEAVPVSARSKQGLAQLKEQIDSRVADTTKVKGSL
jgi:GTP-binding protein HflX